MIIKTICGLLAFAPLFLNAQTLKGQVFIANTKTAIAGASIYYSGSTIGTISNERGYFSLASSNDRLPVVVSCIGYSSSVINNYDGTKSLIVHLTPLSLQLKEIVISGGYDGMSRAEKERIFLQEFVGTSKIAAKCRVKNLKDVTLIFNRKTKTLRAYCSVPIEIENKALGYHLKYFLESFVRTPRNVTIAGNFIFKESSDKDSKISEIRKKAYIGSRMHLIRALWNDELEKSGFRIHDKISEPPIIADSLIAETDSKKYLVLKNKVTIINMNRRKELSTIYQVGERALIGENGFYNSYLRWAGNMGTERVGDMLPFEYNPKHN